jgi:hypothetical protein
LKDRRRDPVLRARERLEDKIKQMERGEGNHED